MSDYIDRNSAISLFWDIDPENDGSDGGTIIYKSRSYTSNEIEYLLDKLPAMDAHYMKRGKVNKTYTDQLRQLIEYHGADETLTICTEECAELIKEITKYKRSTSHSEQISRRSGLLEEIADVLICIDMMLLIFDLADGELEWEIATKMRRNLERIEI